MSLSYQKKIAGRVSLEVLGLIGSSIRCFLIADANQNDVPLMVLLLCTHVPEVNG